MPHYLRFVTVSAVLIALVVCVPIQAQPVDIEAMTARAATGDALAQVNLGNMYRTGEGVPQDYAEAMRWYRLAADQGHAAAQFNLGVMYTDGNGVPQDYVQAHMWFNLAASRSTGERREVAVQGRDLAASLLTPAALIEAQRLAREWDAAHP